MQNLFSRIKFLIHYNKARILYIDVDVFKKREFDIIIYHVKIDKSHVNNTIDYFTSFKRQNIELIMFLNKILFFTKERYWFIELKMIVISWTIQKLRIIIFNSKHFIVLYIDHVTNSIIVNQTKLIFNSIDKLNMKLVRAFMYLFQFQLKIYYRFDKFNLILDAFNRLSSIANK